jgi:hypothetical protein
LIILNGTGQVNESPYRIRLQNLKHVYLEFGELLTCRAEDMSVYPIMCQY